MRRIINNSHPPIIQGYFVLDDGRNKDLTSKDLEKGRSNYDSLGKITGNVDDVSFIEQS